MVQRCIAAEHPSGQSFVDILLNWWIDWQITFLMIISMSLQIFLVVAGFLRKHTAHRGLHASIWIAFLGMDAVAAYALGLMLGSGCGNVFSLYAPILLFHLGATDAINAYSPADNELWLRYAFKMALEILAAANILSRSGDCPKFLPCGILLFIVGAFKYAERIYGLRAASQAQILVSARPIYKFMSLDLEKKPEASARHKSNLEVLAAGAHPMLVAGEYEWYRRHYSDEHASLQLEYSGSIITYNNILNCPTLQNFVSFYINEVCLAYALFKVYRRFLINLPIHHKAYNYQVVSDVMFADTAARIFRVIDLELSFIFDGVFSKGAGNVQYQGIGIVTRLVSLVLLFAATMDLIAVDTRHDLRCEKNIIHWGFGVLHVLVIAMLLVECTQIYKLVRSNWIRVWLACTYIQKQRLADSKSTGPNDERWRSFYRFQARAICVALPLVGKPKTTHWNFRMEQLSIAVDCLDSVCLHYFALTEIYYMWDVKECREKINNLSNVTAEGLLKYMITKIKEMFKDRSKEAHLPHKKYVSQELSRHITFLARNIEERRGSEFSPSNDTGLELAILNWHVATTVCEMDLMEKPDYRSLLQNNEHIKMSIALSRYCLHLMIRRPQLLPEDRDVARTLYTRYKHDIKHMYLQHSERSIVATLLDAELDQDPESASPAAESVQCGIWRGRALVRELSPEKRWEKVAGLWVNMLIYIAIAENAIPHIEQMGKGGELLTFLWVLLGHLGAARTLLSPQAQRRLGLGG